ncbi:MAG: hypothetical protein AAFY20_18435 [Cyanobacteria bacterium J06639_14]
MIVVGKAEALYSLRPEVPWMIVSDNLQWPDGYGDPPSETAINAEIERLKVSGLYGDPDKLFHLFILPSKGGSIYTQLISNNAASISVLGQTLTGTFKNREFSRSEKLESLQGAINILLTEMENLGLKTSANTTLLRSLLDESGFNSIVVE